MTSSEAASRDSLHESTDGTWPSGEKARAYARMERALEWLAARVDQQPSLDEAARAVDMSPFHFQRTFTRWAGVSPRQFLQALSLTRAKQRLAAGASVLEAALDSGLSGPGRLHDAFVNVEAMTPGEFKRGVAGSGIVYGFHPSPFGECLIMTTSRGVCALGFVRDGQRATTFDDLCARFPGTRPREAPADTADVAARIFVDPHTPPRPPLRLLLCGTRFQIQVWRALLALPPGTCTSYGDLAAGIARPGAARAVGNAVGANPLAYLIPCHRVIRKTGALGDYHWGAGRKLAMIGVEAAASGK